MPLIDVDEYANIFLAQQISQVSRRRPGLGVRRPHAVDPRPGRSRQARRQRPDARRDPRHAGHLDHQRRQGHDQHRQDQLHDRRQRPDHRRRQVQRRRPRLPQRRADPGARRRPGGRRAGRPHRRRPIRTTRTASSSRSSSSPAPTSSTPSTRSRRSCRSSPRAFRRRSRSKPFSTAPRPSAPRWPTSSSRWC